MLDPFVPNRVGPLLPRLSLLCVLATGACAPDEAASSDDGDRLGNSNDAPMGACLESMGSPIRCTEAIPDDPSQWDDLRANCDRQDDSYHTFTWVEECPKGADSACKSRDDLHSVEVTEWVYDGAFCLRAGTAVPVSGNEMPPAAGGDAPSGVPLSPGGESACSELGRDDHAPGTDDCSKPLPPDSICAEAEGYGARIYPLQPFYPPSQYTGLDIQGCVSWSGAGWDTVSVEFQNFRRGGSTTVEQRTYDCASDPIRVTFIASGLFWAASAEDGGSCTVQVEQGGDLTEDTIQGSFTADMVLVQHVGYEFTPDIATRQVTARFRLR